jgi:hypothetical protein
MAYSGRFRPKNIKKYRGDANNITYRSLWELQLFKWLDNQSFIEEWNSEEIIVPYICRTDGRPHRYFVDVWMKFKDGRILIVEVKPEKETKPPAVPKKKTMRYVEAVLTYAKNISKWEQASSYAKDRGWLFEVWTEKTLKGLGMTLLTG